MADGRVFRRWRRELDAVSERIAQRFHRSELRQHATGYLRGLISRVERKNGWQLAEEPGEQTPTNLQHFIARARWDADEVRDDLRGYVIEHPGCDDGILIVDETSFLKKRTKSVGIKRQYSGTAGRIENCQIGVFLAYRSQHGHALIDRRLYLPKEWCEDEGRLKEAKVPESVSFATKPALARSMIRDALAANVPCRFVTADSVYGGDSRFRRLLEEHGLGYVVAVTGNQRLWLGFKQTRVDQIADAFSEEDWQELSCGTGTKGERVDRWTLMPFGVTIEQEEGREFQKALLVRESLSESKDRTYCFCHYESGTKIDELVRIAGSRWAVEECFEQAKGETGLDEYEVRSHPGWHRHITLSMLALAALVVMRKASRAASKKGGRRHP